MRRLILVVLFLALLVVTGWLWNHRFERVPGVAPWTLEDLRASTPEIPGLEWRDTGQGPVLRVSVTPDHPRIGMKLVIPGMAPVVFLHLRFRLTAEGLLRGGQRWEDGRLMVDWHETNGLTTIETDPIATIRDDIRGEFQNMVVSCDRSAAIPSLRVEHLGSSGSFQISELRIESIRERRLWLVGRWCLLAAWWLWAAGFIHTWPGISSIRSVLAAGIWVLFGFQFIIPGPWKIQRPVLQEFHLGPETGGARERILPSAPATAETSLKSGELLPLGEMPIQGSILLRLKFTIQQARPVFHMLLLFGPALVLALCVGARPSIGLSVIAALGIEAIQFAFGYGFGWDDVGDLICDAAGIALAVWVSVRLGRWLRSRSGPNTESGCALTGKDAATSGMSGPFS